MFDSIKRILKTSKLNLFYSNKISRRACLKNCIIGGHNLIGKGCFLSNSHVGYASYIGDNSKFINSSIGKYCSISSNVTVVRGQHPVHFVSTSPYFYSNNHPCGADYVNKIKYKDYKLVEDRWSVIIGNDVWIGSHSNIMEGVNIGDGAIIAAGSMVTKDVPDYAIVMGVPAKIYKMRFSQEDIQYLQKLKWWDKDIEWIKKRANLFESIELLKEATND